MLILESHGTQYLQMIRPSGGGTIDTHHVDIMQTAERQGQVPNLDIWMWDTAAVLRIFQTHLFKREINAAAAEGGVPVGTSIVRGVLIISSWSIFPGGA